MKYTQSIANENQAVIATQRFALGARPDDLKNIQGQAKTWLLNQLEVFPPVEFNNQLLHSNDILILHSDYRKALKLFRQQKLKNNAEQPQNPHQTIYKDLSADALEQSINSSNSFNWRCLDFFSNHFSVTAQGKHLESTLNAISINTSTLYFNNGS